MNRKIYFENLDSLRFFAFFSVFILHFESRLKSVTTSHPFLNKFISEYLPLGSLGVNFFFVLSGFLITWLLLKEEGMNGKYNWINFWIRRIFRIWPLYFLCVIYGFWIFKIIQNFKGGYFESANVAYFLSFMPNFNTIANGFATNTTLNVLWSVGVEEQFYLLWPILFSIKKLRPLVLFGIIIGSIYFRYSNINFMSTFSSPPLKFHSFNVMGDLAIGALTAWLANEFNLKQNYFKVNKLFNLALYIIGFFLIIFKSDNDIFQTLQPLLISMFFAFIIFDQTFNKLRFFNLGKIGFFDFWGKYTYGLYCLHTIGILISYNLSKFLKFDTNLIWLCTIEFGFALILSMFLSYYCFEYYESKFLKIKKKYSFLSTGK